MKDEALQAREWFLNELKKWSTKSGKPLNIFGRAEYEQRLKDESENSFFPKPRKDQESQPLPKPTPSLTDEDRQRVISEFFNGLPNTSPTNNEEANPPDSTSESIEANTSEQKTQSTNSRKPVFLMRGEGQSWEEFKKFCIKRFREAGLIKDESPDLVCSDEENDRRFQKQGGTTITATSIKHDPKMGDLPALTITEEPPKADEHGRCFPAFEDELSDAERAEHYGNSGDNKIGDRDYEGAIEDLSEAIRLDPQNNLYYSWRGVAYYELGRHEEAIKDYCRSIEIIPSPANLYNRAESYYKTGKDSEALADLDHALKLAHEMPGYNFLIPECQKLISIIKDKSMSREDYYQAPIGWENIGSKRESVQPHHEELDDVGPEVISFVYVSMRIDDEWSTIAPRGFTWWGHQLAQRIWADDCRRDEGADVTLMHVETDFLRNVENNERTYEALNDLNAGTSQFAFIYDIKKRCIRLHSTVYTHRQNLEWSKRLFLKAVGLQVSYAQRMLESFSHLFSGSEPDTSPHPDNGFRPEMDELVGLIDNFYIPMGEKEAPSENGAFRFTKENLPPHLLATAGDDWLTVEFPFWGDEPACVRLALGKPGVVTSLFRVNSTEGHPLLGKGLMIRMMLPVSYDREQGLKIAMTLNLLEATEWVKCHLNGAWCVDERSNLVFVSFFPIAGFNPGMLVNLAMSCAVRSMWAGQVLAVGEADHTGRANGMLH